MVKLLCQEHPILEVYGEITWSKCDIGNILTLRFMGKSFVKVVKSIVQIDWVHQQSKCDVGNKPNFELYGKVICESGQKYCVQIDWVH